MGDGAIQPVRDKAAPVHAVIFDFFDTLAVVDRDTPPMFESLTNFGYPCTLRVERLYNSEGFNGLETPAGSEYEDWRRRNIRQLCAHVGVPDEIISEVADDLLDIDRKWTVKAGEGAREVIADLRGREIPIAIASNWDYDLRPYLKQAGLSPYIPHVTSAQVGARKPHPKPLVSACNLIDGDPRTTIYVGDDWNCDIVGAVRAHMIPFWLSKSEPPEPGVRTGGQLLDVLAVGIGA